MEAPTNVMVAFWRPKGSTLTKITIRHGETLKDIVTYNVDLVEVQPMDIEEIYINDIIDAICGLKFVNQSPVLRDEEV